MRNHLLAKTVAEDLLGFVALPDELARLHLLRLAVRSHHRRGGATPVGGGISWRLIGGIITGVVGNG